MCCFFVEFLFRQKIGSKSNASETFADNCVPGVSCGRGRRERRRAREEKEEVIENA